MLIKWSTLFWIGVYPGINQVMIEYVKEVFEKFITTYVK